jgi:uncharacterized SAM-binding protein YcdF (DUF218 family)
VSPKTKRWRFFSRIVFWIFLAVVLLAFCFPKQLVSIRHEPQRADAIVILGGDAAGDRTTQALELLKQGYSDRILLTGEGNLALVTNWFQRAGVSLDRLSIEKDATSTYENAKLSEPWLRQWSATNVILVTSSFHSRRALCVFQRRMPDVKFVSVPSAPAKEQQRAASSRLELLKMAVYWIAYGVPPWTRNSV